MVTVLVVPALSARVKGTVTSVRRPPLLFWYISWLKTDPMLVTGGLP
jgi:hypothetical protein